MCGRDGRVTQKMGVGVLLTQSLVTSHQIPLIYILITSVLVYALWYLSLQYISDCCFSFNAIISNSARLKMFKQNLITDFKDFFKQLAALF